MEGSERELALRTIPLNTLLSYPAVYLAQILSEAGASVPLESMICRGAAIPKIFPMKKEMRFAEGSYAIYDLNIQA